MMYTIYCLIDPRDNSIFYVGRTKKFNSRMSKHRSPKTNKGTPKTEFIQKMRSEGYEFIPEILEVVPKDQGKFWEEFYTELFRSWGFTLYNNIYRKMGNQTSFNGEERKRPVVAISKAGEFVAEYPSIKAARAQLGKIGISHSILRLKKSAGGFVWFYREDFEGMGFREFKQIMDWANTSDVGKPNSGQFKKGHKTWNKRKAA